jgi:LAS superfamily LD-carboxypeptidase LdcB
LEEYRIVKNNRILRLITGTVLLALFVFVLISIVRNYDPVRLMQDAQPVEVTVTVEVTVPAAVPPQETTVPEEAAETPVTVAPPDPDSPEGRAALLGLPAPPDVDVSGWEFILANATHSIETYAPPEIETLEGQQFDTRIIEPMKAFVAAARAEGLSVFLSSGYRDYATQQYLYNRKISQGYTPEQAATIVLPPGTSEHQTGLVCDITDQYYDPKDWTVLEKTALYQWMSEHCQEYGFIVRYPKNKSGLSADEAKTSVTGIIYEPWHYRYVGVEAATYIMENEICLEEFLALYE